MPPRRKPPPPTLVLFVRHGLTPTTGKVLPGQARGLHLADTGRAQAQRTGERVAALPRVGAVYSSPLERTRETAAAIARPHRLRVRTDRRLLDADTGDWTGRELKELVRLPEWRVVQRHPSGFRFPGGESFPEMQARMLAAVDDIRNRHVGEAVVVVSHADPIKVAVADAVGSPLDLFQRMNISPASVTAIVYGELGPNVLTVNWTGELDGLVPPPS